MADVDTRITPALHPDNIASLDGYNDSTAPLVADATEALTAAYGYLGSIHDVRAAAMADPTLTKEAALLKVDDHAKAKLTAVTKKFDTAVARFGTTIAAYEQQLLAPVTQKAGEVISTEVRAHLKSAHNRIDLVRKAIQDGDDAVAASALGAPPMLSGLTPEMQQMLLREYHMARSPEIAHRLKVLNSAKSYLEQKGSLVFKEMTKAVGTIEVRIKHKDPDRPDTIRFVGPDEYRAKRDASAAVYAKHG